MKVIEFDPFDSDSIDIAVREVNRYAKERERLIGVYVQRLAQCGEVAAQKAYGPLVTVRAHKDAQGNWEIRADGEQVVFLEFGSGTKTQDHSLSAPLPINIQPGSWSEGPEGKHTWSRWLREQNWSGGYKSYPYDTRPRAGLWEAYKAIQANQDRIAREVFKV